MDGATLTLMVSLECVFVECVVHCTDFAARHCLSCLLAALSSRADDTRLAAYHCLRLYYDHVDAAVAQHHHAVPTLLRYLLDCVRYGVNESNARLPCIVTTFLARAAYLLTTPGNVIPVFSARCNIYILCLCYNVSVRLSVTEVHCGHKVQWIPDIFA